MKNRTQRHPVEFYRKARSKNSEQKKAQNEWKKTSYALFILCFFTFKRCVDIL
jgi:hypothetical protein